MRGDALRGAAARRPVAESQAAVAAQPARGKKRVLFVCIGNSCRSPMAEAFARAYGSDVVEVQSAGLAPAAIVQPLTKQVLEERNISAGDLFAKGLELLRGQTFDVIVNMSGLPMPSTLKAAGSREIVWPVTDPIGQKESVYREVAARIETLVVGLILELRSA